MRLIIVITCICLFTACRKKEAIPQGVMNREKMEAVLWDMMRADQYLTNFLLQNDTGRDRQVESVRLYQQVLAIHSITKEELERSVNYYKTHPILMKDIMDSLSKPRTLAPTLPVPGTDSLKPAGEERIIEPLPIPDSIRLDPKRRRLPMVPNKSDS